MFDLNTPEGVRQAQMALSAVAPAISVEPEPAPIVTEFARRALPLIERDVPVIPLGSRSKKAFLTAWEDKATIDRAQIAQWAREYPDANVASVAKARPGGVWFFDADRAGLVDRIENETGHKFPLTFMVRSRPGSGHYYFRQTTASIAMGNRQSSDTNGELWSARVSDRYVVGPLSVHPDTGGQYEIISNAPIADAPQWLIQYCIQNDRKTEKVVTGHAELDNEEPIAQGGRNNALTSILGKARQALKMDCEQLYAYGLSVNEKRCRPPLPDHEVRTIANSIGGYAVKESGAIVFPESQQEAKAELSSLEDDERRKKLADDFIAEYDKEKQPHSHYQMTEEEFDRETEKRFPVYILPKQAGPTWDNSVLYGAAGRLVQKAAQFNESHPAGMLVDFIVSLGSIIGRGPYFNISATKHYTNEFMARVGDSSRSRKGTGRDVIDQVLKLVDPVWYSDRIESGFGSGEAIIGRIRDASVEPAKLNHKTGKFESITVPGVQDKRLCIREGELASVFVLAGKTESRADIILRDGWDGKSLRNIVKGKGKDGFSNSAKCEEPHLSISGDTTISELRAKMPTGADENGFGNRFLYVYVHRVKDCPHGAPDLDWSQEIVEFQEVVKFARTVKHVSMSDQARKWWNKNYSRFEHEGPDGLAGKMTARAAAHIRRIAMIYALIDLTDQIELEHFQAAEKLWNYCEESAMFIFGGITKEQLRIVKWIDQRETATYGDVRDELYSRHRPAADIKADLDSLIKARHLFEKSGVYATGSHVGRLAA